MNVTDVSIVRRAPNLSKSSFQDVRLLLQSAFISKGSIIKEGGSNYVKNSPRLKKGSLRKNHRLRDLIYCAFFQLSFLKKQE